MSDDDTELIRLIYEWENRGFSREFACKSVFDANETPQGQMRRIKQYLAQAKGGRGMELTKYAQERQAEVDVACFDLMHELGKKAGMKSSEILWDSDAIGRVRDAVMDVLNMTKPMRSRVYPYITTYRVSAVGVAELDVEAESVQDALDKCRQGDVLIEQGDVVWDFSCEPQEDGE